MKACWWWNGLARPAAMASGCPWTRRYERDDWLNQLLSRSDHTALEPEVLERLLDGIGGAIDDHGGAFTMRFEAVLISAHRRSTD